MAENNYTPDSEGVLVQKFTEKDQNVKGGDQWQKDKAWVRQKAANLVSGLFGKATQNKDVSTLGRNDEGKTGDQVLTADMGLIETSAIPPAIPEKPLEEQQSPKTHASLEDWAIAAGKSDEYQAAAVSPVEENPPKTFGSLEEFAKDKGKTEEYEAAKKALDQDNTQSNTNEPIFKDNPTNPRLETSDRNPSVIAAENDVAGHIRINQNNRQMDAEDEANAKADREASGESWTNAHGDNNDTNRLESSDRNQSVQDAQADVEGHLGMMDAVEEADKNVREEMGRRWSTGDQSENPADIAERQNAGQVDQNAANEVAASLAERNERLQREAEERQQSGEGWIDAQDDASPDRLQTSDKNPSVIAAEQDVEGHQRMDANNRQADQTERRQAGNSWNALDNDRQYPTDTNGNPIRPPVPGITEPDRPPLERVAPGNEPLDYGAFGEITPAEREAAQDQEGRQRLMNQEVDRWDQLAQEENNDQVGQQRERTRRRINILPRGFRRSLALAGLIAAAVLMPDNGPANPVLTNAAPGPYAKVEAPYVAMPEGPKVGSPLDNLPKTTWRFASKGPAGETISPLEADLGGRFDAEWANRYLKAHPEYIDQHPDQFPDGKKEFDMRHPELLDILRQDETYKAAKEVFLNYIGTHEIRGGNSQQKVDVQRNPYGSVDKVIISVPSPDGVEVPDIYALAEYVESQKDNK